MRLGSYLLHKTDTFCPNIPRLTWKLGINVRYAVRLKAKIFSVIEMDDSFPMPRQSEITLVGKRTCKSDKTVDIARGDNKTVRLFVSE